MPGPVRPGKRIQPAPPAGLLRAILHLPVYLYRARLGILLGHRFLLLVHRGRRSGRRYETVLEVVRYDPATEESVVVAGWGRRTAWLHNVEAGGALAVGTGRRRYAPAHRLLEADEAAAVMAGYEHRNRFIGPILRAVLSRLVGWRYDGTDAARRRLVTQLPLLAFRPPSADSLPSPWLGYGRSPHSPAAADPGHPSTLLKQVRVTFVQSVAGS